MKTSSLLTLLILLATTSLQAQDFRLAFIFQDHMVLQRQKPVTVWGWATPGATVTVSFDGQNKSTTADGSGRWEARLSPMPANATGQTLSAFDGTTTLSITDVLVGEVWLSAGQSNMARTFQVDSGDYPIRNTQAAAANYPQIRFINFDFNVSDVPLEEMDRQRHDPSFWQVVTPSTVWDSSSLHYFFSKKLFEELNVPIGMVQISRSGSNQVSWMRYEDLLSSEPGRYEAQLAIAESNLATDGENGILTWADFEAAVENWRLGFTPGDYQYQDQWPAAAGTMQGLIHGFPCVLYNAMVHPLKPLSMRGIIWHQGEGGPAENYSDRFPAMVRHWRDLYEQEELHFIWGTLAAYQDGTMPVTPMPDSDGSFKDVNQEFVQAEQSLYGENAYLCSFYDLGNGELHWEAKDIAGERMAQAAMVSAYGLAEDATGPVPDALHIDGDELQIRFRQATSGLQIQPSEGYSGLILEDAGGSYAWADVTIDGDTLICTSPSIPNPVNLYYAYDDNPRFTLLNGQDIPAPPFETITLLPESVATLNSFHALPNSGSVSLSWTNPTRLDFAGALVLRREGTAVTDTPVNGTSYSPGDTIGSSTVIYSNAGTMLEDEGLNNDTTYHYKVFAYDTSDSYEENLTLNTTPSDGPVQIGLYDFTDDVGNDDSGELKTPADNGTGRAELTFGIISLQTDGVANFTSIDPRGYDNMSIAKWSDDTALNENEYFSFTVQANVGQSLFVDRLEYDQQRDKEDNSATDFAVRAYRDGQLMETISFTQTGEDWQARTIDFVDFYADDAQPVEFRFYAWNGDDTLNRSDVLWDNIALIGKVHTADGFSNWVSAYTQLPDSTPTADPDGDGIDNLMEYALSIAPDASQTAQLPYTVLDTGNSVKLMYRANRHASDLTFQVQQSTDMVNWSNVPSVKTRNINSNAEEYEATVNDPANKVFLRLNVTSN